MSYINKDLLFLNKKQKEFIESLKNKIKTKIPVKLLNHMTGTLNFSKKLSRIHLIDNIGKYPVSESNKNDINEVYHKLCIACILHDYGKIFNYEELVRIAQEEELGLSEFEIKCKPIIHSFVTPFLIFRDFDISDEIILNAVRSHTIGSTRMNIVDRILYISDKVEPSRDYGDSRRLRKLSLDNIDLGLLEVYKSNIMYVINNNNSLHPDTSNIWNYICGGLKNAT